MLTPKKQLHALHIVEQFSQGQDFNLAGLQNTLTRLVLLVAQHQPVLHSLAPQDLANLQELNNVLQQVQAYYHTHPNKAAMLEELRKAGVTVADVHRVMLYVDNRLQRRKDYKGSAEEKLFLRVWGVLSEND